MNGFGQDNGGVSIVWLSNGLLIGVLLSAPRRQWLAFIGVAALVDFLVNLAGKTPIPYAFYWTSINMLEVLIAASFMYPVVAPNPDLTEPRQFRRFLFFGILLAPLVASFFAAIGLKMWLGRSLWLGLQFWFAADVVGIATMTPLYLSYHHRQRFSPRSNVETIALISGVIVVSFVVFGLCKFPMLWLVMLSLILLTVRMGLTGSAAGLIVISFIGGYFTVAQRGPVSAVAESLRIKILIFQVFLVTNMLAVYLTEVAMAANRRTRSGLQASETRFRLLAESSRDIIVLAGLQGERKYASPAVAELLGYSPDEFLRRDDETHPEDMARLAELLNDCRSGKENGSLAYRCRKKNGSYLWVESSISLMRDAETGNPSGFVYILRDISERKRAEEKLQDAVNTAEHLAMLDSLTGIANRRLLDETLTKEWARAVGDHTYLSLLMIDVDHFKDYNDTYGHVAGDKCLRMMANAIEKSIRRPSDLVARYGGEEFVVILPNTPSDGAKKIANGIMSAIEVLNMDHVGSPFGVVTISLGCATTSPGLESGPDAFVKLADDAMYQAKMAGRNRIELASSEFHIH